MGDRGNDALYGGDGDDLLQGGEDEDRLFGDQATSRLFAKPYDAGKGADTLEGGPGADHVDGHTNDLLYTNDLLSLSRAMEDDVPNVLLSGGSENDIVDSENGVVDLAVACDHGVDSARADSDDAVGSDCETIARP